MSSDIAILINTAVAVLATVLLIVRFKVNPVISLVLGSLYLGLATGMGVTHTVETITEGFGDIMVEVGLLIAFGVLMGSILNATGAIGRLVEHLLRIFGAKRLPYAFALTIGTVLQSIFLDVLLVISAPLARRLAGQIGRFGTARMASAMAISLECGIVFMVPGVASLALAGLLGVPLGKMLFFGFAVVVPTIIISIAIMTFLFHRGFWNTEKDELPFADDGDDAHDGDDENATIDDADDHPEGSPAPVPNRSSHSGGKGGDAATASAPAADNELGNTVVGTAAEPRPPLAILFAPLAASLLLIALGAVFDFLQLDIAPVKLLGNPVVALLIGLIGSTLVCRRYFGQAKAEEAITLGFKESGQILLLTGVGGSLAGVVAEAGLGDILGEFFTASHVAPLLVVWGIAAVLHIAVGSVTLSAITAAGLLSPIAPALGLDPVLIALAAGAGSLFLVHVTSNTFWLLQSLMGQSVRGALKTVSFGVSVASVVSLLVVLLLSVFI